YVPVAESFRRHLSITDQRSLRKAKRVALELRPRELIFMRDVSYFFRQSSHQTGIIDHGQVKLATLRECHRTGTGEHRLRGPERLRRNRGFDYHFLRLWNKHV